MCRDRDVLTANVRVKFRFLVTANASLASFAFSSELVSEQTLLRVWMINRRRWKAAMIDREEDSGSCLSLPDERNCTDVL